MGVRRSFTILALCLLGLALASLVVLATVEKPTPRPQDSEHGDAVLPKRRYFHQGETDGIVRLHDEINNHIEDDVDFASFQPYFPRSTYSERRSTPGKPGSYNVGAGIADVTGEIAEIGFMGYAVPGQTGVGLQMRVRSRAFVFEDATEQPTKGNRVAYVSIDLCMGFQMVKMGVIDRLNELLPGLYDHDNVLISGTHTHATPGGIGGTALVGITTFGFIKPNYDAAVEGIAQSIYRAHKNLAPASIKMAIGQCDDCNINRSPSAYLLNPDANHYANNTDHEMTVLRISNAETGEEMGMLSFFAVHGTSLNNTNRLVSGDNKGYASLVFEQLKNPKGTLPGQGKFVAAFGQSNLGDVSPNTHGPRCPDGSACDFNTSTCGGLAQGCIATGPGVDQYDSMRIIGQRQVDAAMKLYNEAAYNDEFSADGVDYRYQYFDMQTINVSKRFTSTGKDEQTCIAALGYSFAAGTTDGPGDFDFTQGTTHGNPFWNWVSSFLAKPTPEQIACQAPKPILLDVGLIKPIEWSSYILPEQVYRIGNLWILAVPGEFTTMSGRRLRGMVKTLLQQNNLWFDDSHVVIAGLSNSYSHYIATYEEYQQQRYEAASTLYGPHTLAAHMQNFAGLVEAIANKQPVPTGPLPMDMRNQTITLMPGVVEDSVPANTQFGDVFKDVQPSYSKGSMVEVVFWCASPRNDVQLESSFLFVDMQSPSSPDEWTTVAVDGNIETTFLWERVGVDQSQCTIQWQTDASTTEGTYRIRTQGVWKAVGGTLTPFTGQSSTFTINN